MKKKILATSLLVTLVLTLTSCKPAFGKVETITIDEPLRIGVFSDSQLNKDGAYDTLYGGHLKKTFELFKAQNVNLILFAGDLADLVSNEVYETHNRIFDEVFGEDKPEKLYVMGNHDYWYENDYTSTKSKQSKFLKYMNQSPWAHKVVNGFHFIAASPSRGAGMDASEVDWLKEQLAIAAADGGASKPIFVITHHNVPNTVYGSIDWGDKALRGVFDNYPQVVSISGHSHNSLLDERSIYQEKFTAIQTQSISYIEQGDDYHKYIPDTDGYSTIPEDAEVNPMCYIFNLSNTSLEMERWNILLKIEEKAHMRWSLNYSPENPITVGSFLYRREIVTADRQSPIFESGASVTTGEVITLSTQNTGLIFNAATHPDCVYAYAVVLEEQTSGKSYSYSYFSDYYKGLSTMESIVKLGLPSELPSGTYIAKVYAIEAFGKYSNPITSQPFLYTNLPPLSK